MADFNKLAATALRLITANGRKYVISRTVNEYNNVTGQIIFAPPINVSPPALSGDPFVGALLTVSTGTWDGVVSSYTYQWRKNGVAIAGETSNSYTIPSSAFNDDEFDCVVTAINRDNSTSLASDVIIAEIPPINLTPVSIAGAQTIGSTLTATPGTWRNALSLSYQWFKNDSPIVGATTTSYVIPADAFNDDAFKCLEIATNAHASPGVYSNVILAKVRPVNLVAPSIAGTPTIGSTLTATPGTWNGANSVEHAWTKNGAVIAGATATTYVIPSGTRNHDVLAYAEVATNENGSVSALSNNLVAEVLPVNTMPPLISGDSTLGETLTVTPGTWLDADVLGYQWRKNGLPIVGEQGLTFIIPDNAEAGADFDCVESAANEHGQVEESSNIITVTPLLSGNPLPGKTMTSTHALPWFKNGEAFAGASLTLQIPYTIYPGDILTQAESNEIVVLGSEWNFEGALTLRGDAAPITFSRTSLASQANILGIFEQAANNVMRFDYDIATHAELGFLSESQGANLLLRSTDVNLSPWATHPTWPNVNSCIDGQYAQSITTQGGTSAQGGRQTVVLTNSTNYWISVIIERDVTFPAQQFDWGLFNNTTQNWQGLARYNWFTDTIVQRQGSVGDTNILHLGTGPNGGALVRLSFRVNSGTDSTKLFIFYPSGADAHTPGLTTSFHHGQVEINGVTSPVITAGAAAVRQKDTTNVSGMDWFNPSAGVFIAKVRAYPGNAFSTDGFIFNTAPTTDPNRLNISFPAGAVPKGRPQGRIGSAVAAANTAAPSKTEWEYLALAYSATAGSYFARRVGAGAAVASEAAANYLGAVPASMVIMDAANSYGLYLRYFPLEIADAELIDFLNALP